MKTLGLSPKVLVPLAPAVTTFVTAWIATGHVDRSLFAGLVSTGVGAILAYYAPPGIVVELPIVNPEHEMLHVVGGDGSNVVPDAP